MAPTFADALANPWIDGEAEALRFVSIIAAIEQAYADQEPHGGNLTVRKIVDATGDGWTNPVPVVDMFRSAAKRAHDRPYFGPPFGVFDPIANAGHRCLMCSQDHGHVVSGKFKAMDVETGTVAKLCGAHADRLDGVVTWRWTPSA